MSSIPDSFANHLKSLGDDRPTLILGFGREGRSTLRVLRELWPDRPMWVADEAKPDLSSLNDPHLHHHEPTFEDLKKFGVIWKTPAIQLNHPALQTAKQHGSVVTSQLGEFLKFYRDKTIGVTGTKGKSTTSALIHHLLQEHHVPSVLGGNIGLPVFELLPQIESVPWAVVEMSSYQLESITDSPHIAVWLNLFPEHLNYHGSLTNYTEAKAGITRYQQTGDQLIIPDSDKVIEAASNGTRAKIESFDSVQPSWRQLQLDYSAVECLPKIVQTKLLAPAVMAVQATGTQLQLTKELLCRFEPLPHRLTKVGTYRGITFYDDTLATIPQAAMAAIDALPGGVDIIILGGKDRGIDFSPIVEHVIAQRIPHVILMGESGQIMAELFRARNASVDVFSAADLAEAVKHCFTLLPNGGSVLLSPASPSHDQFANYEEKSAEYLRLIKQ